MLTVTFGSQLRALMARARRAASASASAASASASASAVPSEADGATGADDWPISLRPEGRAPDRRPASVRWVAAWLEDMGEGVLEEWAVLEEEEAAREEEAGGGAGRWARASAVKWRLALRSAPVVAGLVGFRLAVWYGAGTGGWILYI